MMRVLFLHSGTEDYLAQGLFHGLRTILGSACVDVPRYDVMYDSLTSQQRTDLRGRGFTLYGLLPELTELADTRSRWTDQIGEYNIVVIANIWRQWQQLANPALRSAASRLVLVDGEDGSAVFPFALHFYRSPRAYFARPRSKAYFKREWLGGGSEYGRFAQVLPRTLRRRLRPPAQVRPLAFSIPSIKVADFGSIVKTKEFPRHIVDPEVAATVKNAFFSAIGSDSYSFDTEPEYYADLQSSRFGVTTRRAGWDCLRHYELAANGCVLCFRDLDSKPGTCAPHGLGNKNCIVYHSADELLKRVRTLSRNEYEDLVAETKAWINANTTEARARLFLDGLMN